MEDGPVYPAQNERAVLQAGGNEKHRRTGNDVAFVTDPHFHLAAQIGGIVRIAAYEPNNLVILLMDMGGHSPGLARPLDTRRYSCGKCRGPHAHPARECGGRIYYSPL